MTEDNSLWMGDIEPHMDESTLSNIFHYFNIYPIGIKLLKDKETNLNRHYCFIYFRNFTDASNALNQLRGKPIPQTNLVFNLNWANTPSSNKTLYIGNLNPTIDDTALYNLFKTKYKSVCKANIISDKGESKGYGFVSFKKEIEYKKCLSEMDGYNFKGNFIRVREQKRKDDDGNNDNNNKNINNKMNQNDNNFDSMNINMNNNLLYTNRNNLLIQNLNNNNDVFKVNINNNNLEAINLNSNNYLNNTYNNIDSVNWVNGINNNHNLNTKINHNNNIQVNISNGINKNTYNIISKSNNVSPHNINEVNIDPFLNYSPSNEINNYNNTLNTNIYNKKNNIMNDNEVKPVNMTKLEILENFDERTLKNKIIESLHKMFEYYENISLNGENKLASKLIN